MLKNTSRNRKQDAVISREESEDTSRASSRDFKQLFNSTHIPQWIYDVESLKLLYVNTAAIREYGYSNDEFLNMTILEIVPEEEIQKSILYNEFMKTTNKPFFVVNAHQKKNYEKILVESTCVNLDYAGRRCVLVTSADITEKIKLEGKKALLKITRQQKITRATINGQEREREEIGRELHDNINQLLTSAKLYMEVARANEESRIDFIQRGEKILLKAINEIRALSNSLAPPTLKDIGFKESLTELFETYLVTKTFNINLSFEEGLDMIDPELQISLFRIIQEQLNNILKHACAQNIVISLAAADQISLSIKDDGKGFDTSEKRKGSGLTNIKNRAAIYNGEVEINSKPNEGCTLLVRIPAQQNDKGKIGTNILIVEDDPDDQETIIRAFAEVAPHCNITCLNDGKMLVNLLQSVSDKKLPALIVLDYNMPLMNGLQTLRLLELDERFSKIPKIIYTSSSLSYNKNLCYSANAKAYITKGASLDEIKENVHEMLSFLVEDI